MATSISAALSQLHQGPQWFEVDDRKLLLRAVADGDLFDRPTLAVILYRGRFGLARVVDRGGPVATEIVWVTGRARPTTVRLHSRRRLRAIVADNRSRWPN